MALATTCPSCSTSFKVHPEQLKLRRGLVRCGVCQHVFSGIKYVRYVSDSSSRSRRRRRKPAHATSPGNSSSDQTITAASVAPETVVDDLKTAFFLPETKLDDSDDPSSSNTAGQTKGSDTPRNEQESTSEKRRQSRRSRRRARRRNQRERDTSAAPARPETTASESGAAQAEKSDAAKPKTDTKQVPPAPTVSPVIGDRATASPQPQRHAEDTQADRSDPGKNSDRHQSDAAIAEFARFEETSPDAVDFGDTLLANLPAAWQQPISVDQTGMDWPDLDGKMADDRLPNAPAQRDQASDTDAKSTSKTEAFAADAASTESVDSAADDPNGERIADPANAKTKTEGDGTVTPDPSPAPQEQHALGPADTAYSDAAHHPGQTEPYTDPLNRNPSSAVDEDDAIDYFGRTSRPAFDFDLPGRNIQLLAGCLVVLLVLQLAIGARDSLAARFSFARPALEAVAKPLGLTINAPVRPDDVKILSLNVSGPIANKTGEESNAYIMNLLLRNTGQLTARWPAVELVVTDQSGGRLVQKVLMPADYLNDAQRAQQGMAPNSEEYLRLNMRAHGVTITNIYGLLFYP